jgi:hypothetical protein
VLDVHVKSAVHERLNAVATIRVSNAEVMDWHANMVTGKTKEFQSMQKPYCYQLIAD